MGYASADKITREIGDRLAPTLGPLIIILILFCWQEIVINIALILHFLAAGFASAVIASKWRKEPWPCTVDPDAYGGDFCDIVLLMAMNSVQCVSISTHYCVPSYIKMSPHSFQCRFCASYWLEHLVLQLPSLFTKAKHRQHNL